jgi:hypothetical protein
MVQFSNFVILIDNRKLSINQIFVYANFLLCKMYLFKNFKV